MTPEETASEQARWRVGRKVPVNVYDGDRAVCQCHNEVDARLIVEAVNSMTAKQRQQDGK